MRTILVVLLLPAILGMTKPEIAKAAGQAVTLVQDGVARVAIYAPTDVMADDKTVEAQAPYEQQHAENYRRRLRESVKDLAHYLEKMSGAKVAVLTTAPTANDKRLPILIGDLAAKTFGPIKQRTPYKQGWRLVVSPKGIGLMGESHESASYAIYEVLDRLGCRWFMPSEMGEVIPAKKTIVLPVGDTSTVAGTFERNVWYADEAFMRRNRIQQGRMEKVAAGHALEIHNGDNYGYLTKKQLEENPEWNAMIGGKRSINGRFCWGNPEVSAAVAEGVIAALDKRYQPSISLSPDDGSFFCECEKCKALDAGDWDGIMDQVSITDRYIHFNNRIAERVTKKYPDVKMGILAYVQFTQAPVREKVHPNLVPMIAPINYCRAHAMTDDCISRQKVRQILEGWAKKSDQLAYYNYMFNLAEYSAPYPMMHQMSEELPIIFKNKVKFWTPEGISNFESVLPGHYLSMRMAWNPKLQPAQVLNEFFTLFYGAAEAPMRKYWTLFDDQWTNVPEHAGSGFSYVRRFTPEFMKEARRAMDAALAACRTPMEQRRVKMQDEALKQFELFMQLRWDLNSGKLATLGPLSERWMSRQLELGNEYEAQYAFGKVYWTPVTAPAVWFRAFFQTAYLDGTRIANNFDVISPPLRNWRWAQDKARQGEALGWYAADFNDAGWKTTDVGVDTWYKLGMDNYYGPAWYRQTVKVPDVPAGKKIYLWVSSEDGNIKLFVNGKHVPYVNDKGETLDQFTGGYCTPISFDITAAVKPGADNQISIIGTHIFVNELGTGGLMGPVYLYRER